MKLKMENKLVIVHSNNNFTLFNCFFYRITIVDIPKHIWNHISICKLTHIKILGEMKNIDLFISLTFTNIAGYIAKEESLRRSQNKYHACPNICKRIYN